VNNDDLQLVVGLLTKNDHYTQLYYDLGGVGGEEERGFKSAANFVCIG
jgi:hypothetical protein